MRQSSEIERRDYGLYFGAPAVLETWGDGLQTVCRIWGPGETFGPICEREIAYSVEQSWTPAAEVPGDLGEWLRARATETTEDAGGAEGRR